MGKMIASILLLTFFTLPATNEKASACSARPLILPTCDGFTAMRPRNQLTVKWLYANDPVFADEILGNNKHGQSVCGWKP